VALPGKSHYDNTGHQRAKWRDTSPHPKRQKPAKEAGIPSITSSWTQTQADCQGGEEFECRDERSLGEEAAAARLTARGRPQAEVAQAEGKARAKAEVADVVGRRRTDQESAGAG